MSVSSIASVAATSDRGADRPEDGERVRCERRRPPGGDDVVEIGHVVAVQMGEEDGLEGARAGEARRPPAWSTPRAGVEQEVAGGRAHQGGGAGPVGGGERAAAAQDHYLHVDHSRVRRDQIMAESMTRYSPRRPPRPGPGRYPDARAVLPRAGRAPTGGADLRGEGPGAHSGRATAAGLTGTVVEIGFGSGFNVPHYPGDVDQVLAVEPSATAFRMAGRRIECLDGAGRPGRPRRTGATAWTTRAAMRPCAHSRLCTIPDVGRRAGRDPAGAPTRWPIPLPRARSGPGRRGRVVPARVEPVQRRLADGCHLTRDPVALARSAGFAIEEVDQDYGAGPKAWTYLTRAVAVRA